MAKAKPSGLDTFLASVAAGESGGNYSAVNKGSGALGKYQVLPSNVASWSQRVLGHSITPQQFLASPQLQEQIVHGVLGDLYKQYGVNAAAVWYIGHIPSGAEWDQVPPGNTLSPRQYVNAVAKRTGDPSVVAQVAKAGTGSAPAGAAAGTTAPAPAHYDQQTLAQQFGYQAAFFNTDPTLQHWMQAALAGKFGDLTTTIGDNRATAALHATKWWTTHDAAQRQWQSLQTSDPNEAKRQIQVKTQDVLNLARSEGVTMDANTANQIAKAALSNGLDDSHLKLAVDSHAAYHANVAFGGQLGQLHDQYAQLASQYGVQLSDQTISQWAVNTLQGKQTDQDFLNLVKQQSSSKYTGAADQIAAGTTPQQIADNYKQSMASLLEVNPDSIDWKSDPLIQQAMQYQQAPTGSSASSGTQAPGLMPVWQFEQKVKADPRWQYTDNAKQSILTAVAGVGRDFGFA